MLQILPCMSNLDESAELARIRAELGWTIRKFATELGITETRYKPYEYGMTKKIPVDVMDRARKFLSKRRMAKPAVTVEEDRKILEGFAVTVAVRAWESALAGLDNESECFFEPTDAPYEIPSAFLVGGLDMVDFHDLVRVSGRSMSPLIEPGDRVLFFQDSSPRRNTVVMAQCPENRIFIKVLRDVKGVWELHSLNPQGAQFDNLRGWKIHGYAVAILRDPDGGNMNIMWPFGQPIKVPD